MILTDRVSCDFFSAADPSSPQQKSAQPSVPFAIHHLSSTLVLPSSHPSSLQFYDPTTSRLLSELEVSPSNRVSRRDEKALEPCRVEKVAVSEAGDWMVTVDAREGDESSHGEVYLKIWSWDVKSSSWNLNTRIDRPHGPAQVTAAAFRPQNLTSSEAQLVTTGKDGNIKIWRTRTSKTKNGQTEGRSIYLHLFHMVYIHIATYRILGLSIFVSFPLKHPIPRFMVRRWLNFGCFSGAARCVVRPCYLHSNQDVDMSRIQQRFLRTFYWS